MGSKINVAVRGISMSDATSVFKTKVLKAQISLSDQITAADTKYVIKWNFDMHGEELTIPNNCILDFDGGQLLNGTIHWNDTKVLNRYRYAILVDVTEDGDKIEL